MQCLICGSATEQFFDEEMGVVTYYCAACTVIFKDPETYEDFRVQKQRYDLHENHAEDEGYRKYFQHFLDVVLPQIPTPSSALDFGTGSSTLLSDMLAEQRITSTAYDPIYHPDTSYRKQKYDLITAVEVFEHLHDPAGVFDRLVSLLNPGGTLAIRTELVPADRGSYLKWYYRRDPTHVVFFAPQTFQVMCQKRKIRYLGDNGKNILWVGLPESGY